MSTDPSSSRGPAPAFNLDEALQRVDGDRDLLAEIAGIFLSDAPAMVADVARRRCRRRRRRRSRAPRIG